MPSQILCVDPDDEARAHTVERLRSELAASDVVYETAGTLADATDALSRETDAVITEYELPDGTGLELIKKAGEVCPDASCVLYTDTDPDTIDTTLLQGDVLEYVGKSSTFGKERLVQLLDTLLERRSQASYPIPQSEDERLAALQAYDLDNPSLQTSLNRIADLAADHFEVESASVNIIEEHSQEFLACHGAAAEWESMDREDSICTFTILEDQGVMAVDDVTTDPRFQSRSDTLIEYGIRAYLGANLVTANGLVIGVLCVYDDTPRSFSPADKTYLQKLAQTSMDLIELHTRAGPIEQQEVNQ